MSESLTKANTYVVIGPKDASVTKANTYVVLDSNHSVAFTKANTYLVLDSVVGSLPDFRVRVVWLS